MRAFSLLLALALAAPPASGQTISEPEERNETQRFEAEDVFSLEWAADPQVAPDGRSVVYVRTGYSKQSDRASGALWVLDRERGTHRPLVTERAASSPRFSPSGDRIAYRSGGALRIRFLDNGADFALAEFDEAPGAFSWSPDGQHLAFTMFVPGPTPSFASAPSAPEGADWAPPVRVFDDLNIRFDGQGWLRNGATHMFVVPAEGGEPRALTDGEQDFSSPVWLNIGTILVVGNDAPDADFDPVESEIYAVDVATGDRRALTSRDGPDGTPAVSPDGALVAYTGFDDVMRAYQQPRLYVMNPDGSGVRALAADLDHPIANPTFSPDGQRIYALIEDFGQTSLISVGLDGSVERHTDDVGGTSLGRPYASGSFSVGGAGAGVVAYTQQRVDRPADIAVLADGRAQRLTDLNEDALGHLDLATIEEIEVPSSHDGRPIEAWIALPPGFTADGSYPLVLEIHGGPFAMYGPSFAAEIQRFAAEGFVTVYANPRGSTGYGDDFAQQIHRAYPSEDYDDLISVVDAVIERGYVDPERLFVTGGSGGGVLTAWIVGKTDRFAAAASVKPVMNWETMATTADIGAFIVRNWLGAPPWENPELYRRLSPISLVGNIVTPTLVMVGEEDWRTPTWEAEQLYGALKLQDVPAALVRVPGASHAIARRPSHLIAKVDNIVGWFRARDPKAE
jgi:acylaminoacyl-peptidase